jgi:hypothetical protein
VLDEVINLQKKTRGKTKYSQNKNNKCAFAKITCSGLKEFFLFEHIIKMILLGCPTVGRFWGFMGFQPI